jgi:hypothetical protein
LIHRIPEQGGGLPRVAFAEQSADLRGHAAAADPRQRILWVCRRQRFVPGERSAVMFKRRVRGIHAGDAGRPEHISHSFFNGRLKMEGGNVLRLRFKQFRVYLQGERAMFYRFPKCALRG